ncbi:MAG TPA: response regulator [Pirellulales bacterium]|nr:response regulator [Pirellulales bacterium]
MRIVVADDDESMLHMYMSLLGSLGHRVETLTRTGRELVEQCHVLCPDLVISDFKMPDMDGLEAAAAIYEEAPTPVIMISGYHDTALIQRAQDVHVLVFLVKPVSMDSLSSGISLAMRRFREFRLLRQEAFDLRQTWADRKVVEQAKQVLMTRARLDEHEAFSRIEGLAAQEHQTLCRAAQMVLKVERALRPAESAAAMA